MDMKSQRTRSAPVADRPVLPPVDLMARVAGLEDPDWFWNSGDLSLQGFESALGLVGAELADFSRILEWGCGCGRILLHSEQLSEEVDLYGVDIDGEAIAWAKTAIPWVTFSVCDGLPPLGFPDSHFDLILNHSVFTHLDASYQDAWLAELRRVLKPGGYALLSVSGDHPFAGLEAAYVDAGADPEPLQQTRRSEGILHIRDDSWVGGPFPDFYHSTFHAPWYVFQHWAEFFDIKAYIVRGSLDFQDLVLVRRPEQL